MTKLTNTTDKIKEIFQKEEEKLKKNKKNMLLLI